MESGSESEVCLGFAGDVIWMPSLMRANPRCQMPDIECSEWFRWTGKGIGIGKKNGNASGSLGIGRRCSISCHDSAAATAADCKCECRAHLLSTRAPDPAIKPNAKPSKKLLTQTERGKERKERPVYGRWLTWFYKSHKVFYNKVYHSGYQINVQECFLESSIEYGK